MKRSEKKINNAINWIESLFSGEYEQGKGFLCLNNKYCCWGVGCEVTQTPYKKDKHVWNNEFFRKVGLKKNGNISPNLETTNGSYYELWEANDSGVTFKEIAEYLIKHSVTNFIPTVHKGIQKHFN